jgi:hypothetical protein
MLDTGIERKASERYRLTPEGATEVHGGLGLAR